MSAKKILVLNGPNLDMLGMREPEVYGTETLGNLEYEIQRYGDSLGVEVSCFQSNSEGKLIGKIHSAMGRYDGIIYNPGAHTHYSYALRDAVASIDVPVVEVHLSDIESREPFRRVSVIAPACIAQVRGMGVNGYRCALDILRESEHHERLGEGFSVPAGESIVIGSAGDPSADDSGGSSEAISALLAQGDIAPVPVEAGHRADDAEGADVAKGAEGAEAMQGAESAQITEDVEDAAQLSLRRQSALREACAQKGVLGLYVRDTSNIRWLTALDGVFDEERAHVLLAADGHAILHTDSRYANAVRSEAGRIGSNLIVDEGRVSHAKFVADALSQEGAPSGRLGFEDTVTYAEYVKLVENLTTDRLSPTTDVVVGLRAVKDRGEIARMRAAQAITDAAFLHIIEFMRPGMTEREVQLELEGFMARRGAEGLAFSSIVAAGANGADPHAIPGDTRLEAGQCVVMDFGARARGYCSDMTRTVFLGAPEGAMAEAWEVLRRANETVEATLMPGVTGAEAHELAERILEEGGFGSKMGHGLGHGVGIDVHELPVLNSRNKAPLVEGNVVTVEPGIYLPGEFGMRLEDFGVITASGYDVFTQSTHETVII